MKIVQSPQYSDKRQNRFKIFVVDDHPILRLSLVSLINSYDTTFEVCGEARSAEEALTLIDTHLPDVLLTDLHMSPLSGIDLIKIIKDRYPTIRFVIFSASTQEEYILQALEAGAAGYVFKESEEGELVIALKTVANGDTFFPAAIKNALDRQKNKPALTKRELDVLYLIGNGLTSKEIARKIGIDYRTIDTYRARIRQRFGLESSAALLRFAIEKKRFS
jgi:DNA-binding NarL/FixJ family response regulator